MPLKNSESAGLAAALVASDQMLAKITKAGVLTKAVGVIKAAQTATKGKDRVVDHVTRLKANDNLRKWFEFLQGGTQLRVTADFDVTGHMDKETLDTIKPFANAAAMAALELERKGRE